MNIPREGDMVRFYIQLPPDTDFVDRQTGRVDLAKASPDRIMEAAARIMQPYHVARVGDVEWWTVYISASGGKASQNRKLGANRRLCVQSDSVSRRRFP